MKFELLSRSLYEVIRGNEYKGLPLATIRRYAVQILESLKFLKQHKIIHCDLKPENVLLRESNGLEVRVIDVGSSCFETERLYPYVQSRYYRSPEVVLEAPYTCCIDMWSFGCLLAELFVGAPLFPGESESELLCLFMECLGLPPLHLLNKAGQREEYFDADGPIIQANSKGVVHMPGTKTLSQRLNCENPQFLSLIRQCLEWDPEKRITPEEALRHEWVAEGHPGMVRQSRRGRRFSVERRAQNGSLAGIASSPRVREDARGRVRKSNGCAKASEHLVARGNRKVKEVTARIYKRRSEVLPELRQRRLADIRSSNISKV